MSESNPSSPVPESNSLPALTELAGILGETSCLTKTPRPRKTQLKPRKPRLSRVPFGPPPPPPPPPSGTFHTQFIKHDEKKNLVYAPPGADSIPLEALSGKPEGAQTGLLVYCGIDSATTGEIAPIQSRQFKPSTFLVYNFERALLAPTMDMMRRGVRVNALKRSETITELEATISEQSLRAWQITNEMGFRRSFKISSNADLQKFFYDFLLIPPVTSYSDGEKKVTTNRTALKKIRDDYPGLASFVDLILDTKDLQKLVGTLKMGLRGNRFHASFNFATETGRWSSSKGVFGEGSNAQNLDPRFRRLLLPDPGKILVYIDLKSAESICVAYLAGDPAYIDATMQSDIHTYVARLCWPDLSWPADPALHRGFAEATKIEGRDIRFLSKKGGHGASYGGQPETLAGHMGIPVPVAEEFVYSFFTAFPGIPRYHTELYEALNNSGTFPTLRTPFGRERQFFGRARDSATLREALAFLPQSLTADSLNLGLLRVWHTLAPYGVELLLQVHDAILCQVPIDHAATLIPQIIETLQVDVPVRGRTMRIPAEAEIGYNWDKFDPEKPHDNPHGMRSWSPGDPILAPPPPAAVSTLFENGAAR